jgi:hypothetical protein
MKNIRLVYLIIFLISLISINITAQNSIISKNSSYVFRFLPSTKRNIYGLSFGLVGSETICNIKGVKNSHGINIQLIGQGVFIPLNFKTFRYENSFKFDSSWMVSTFDSNNFKARHNGLLISTFGTMTDEVNGITISALSSMGHRINGFSFNLLMNLYTFQNGVSISLYNASHKLNGIQIGLINKSTEVHGLQIGLWNENEKRKLPFVNW